MITGHLPNPADSQVAGTNTDFATEEVVKSALVRFAAPDPGRPVRCPPFSTPGRPKNVLRNYS